MNPTKLKNLIQKQLDAISHLDRYWKKYLLYLGCEVWDNDCPCVDDSLTWVEFTVYCGGGAYKRKFTKKIMAGISKEIAEKILVLNAAPPLPPVVPYLTTEGVSYKAAMNEGSLP